MFAKIAVLACALAVANAGYAAPALAASYAAPAYTASYAAPAYTASYAAPALTATSENVYRSAGNLHTVSTQSKSIATPFSSSNKQITTVSNPGVYAHAAPVAYASYAAAPAYATSYAAPAVAKYAAAPAVAYSAPVAHAAYSAPIAHEAAPVAYSAGLTGGLGAYATAPAPIARSVHGASLLGVAYSPAVAVSHMTYSSPIGINYSW